MAVAHDQNSESHTGSTGSVSEASFTWDHTPVGTAAGILVFVHENYAGLGNSTRRVSTVTADGVDVPEVASSSAVDTAGEPGRVTAFFLGSSVPSGTLSIVVNRTNDTCEMYATAHSQTAGANTEATGVVLEQGDQALTEENVTDGSTGVDSVRYASLFSGLNGAPSTGANSTAAGSLDYGNQISASVRETTAGQGSRPVGWSAASDDVAAVYLAIREVVAAGTTAFVAWIQD